MNYPTFRSPVLTFLGLFYSEDKGDPCSIRVMGITRICEGVKPDTDIGFDVDK